MYAGRGHHALCLSSPREEQQICFDELVFFCGENVFLHTSIAMQAKGRELRVELNFWPITKT